MADYLLFLSRPVLQEADALKQRYRDQSDDEDSDDDSEEEEDEDEDQEKPGKKKKKKKKKKLNAIQFANKYTKLRKKVHELSGGWVHRIT